jgi:hypothetical protein
MGRKRKTDRVVPAIEFYGNQMTAIEIYHRFGRAKDLSYQTIRKRIASGDRSERDILRPVQISEERRAYLTKYDPKLRGTAIHREESLARAQGQEALSKLEARRRLALFLRGGE